MSVKPVNCKAVPPELHALVLLEYTGIPIWVQVRIVVHSLFAVTVWKKARIFVVKGSFNLRQTRFEAEISSWRSGKSPNIRRVARFVF
jgi:hypothetical protein